MVVDEVGQAVKILKEGGVVIFPTDTVWGIGVSINRLDAIRRLYEIKKREKNKATAVLVADVTTANILGVIDEGAKALIDKFWPGGLTLVVKAKAGVTQEIMGQTGTIGLRQPNQPLALALLKRLNTGLVTASANIAGQPAPLKRELIDQTLIDQVDFLLSGEAGGQPPSTVIDVTTKPYKILRQGIITAQMLGLLPEPSLTTS